MTHVSGISAHVENTLTLPYPTLPWPADVCQRATGTNNQELLKSPFYVGVKHQRVRGDAYYELIDELMSAVKRRRAVTATDSRCCSSCSLHAL